MYELTRGVATLLGAAVAGVLIWLATQVTTVRIDVGGASGDYWAVVGLTAAAGLVLALSQVGGISTRWGLPRFSLPVLVVAFLPSLVVGGLILLAAQPQGGWERARATDVVTNVGVDGLVHDLGTLFPVIALGLGFVFGLVFDTGAAPVSQRFDERAADEATTAERAEVEREPTMTRDEALARARGEAIAGDGSRD